VVGLSIKDVIESMTQAIQTDDEEIPAETVCNSPRIDLKQEDLIISEF